ncbi:hypothetical protein TNCV_1795091 [Trichonephila clavipes]|nr:hypothetical protein TNCV_1795091 [Trichonephila clavipes]
MAFMIATVSFWSGQTLTEVGDDTVLDIYFYGQHGSDALIACISMQNKFIPSFMTCQDWSRCFVKAEMKKKGMYKPSVQIRTTCQVFRATCTCLAGGTPAFCKHVFALLHAINDYIAKKLYEALNFFRSHFFI